MLYLIKNLPGTYTIAVSELIYLYQDSTHVYSVSDNTYSVNDKIYANVICVPRLDNESDGILHQQLIKMVDTIYKESRDTILSENKDKFVITAIQFKPDNSKDVLYSNFYKNLMTDSIEYNNLVESSSMHHYEIYNYGTGKFEVFIKKEDALRRLEYYMDEFILEYKSTVVKEFYDPQEFLLYIDSINSV